MTQPRALPHQLVNAPFATAVAIALDVAPRRLRALDVQHPFRGVNSTSAVETMLERATAYRSRMLPGQVFSHETAAAVYGMPFSGAERGTELHVSVAFPRTPPRTRGVRGHSISVVDQRSVRGLPVCSPVQVWRQLAASLSGPELTAVGDHIVGARARHALATIDELRATAAVPSRIPGAAALRWAAERIRFGADSRPETLLRLALVEAGLREPAVNPPVFVGARLVHPDLVYFDERLILEYEGDGHRTDAAQWHADIGRHDAMVDSGWRVVRVTRCELFADRPAFLLRVAELLSARAVGAVRRTSRAQGAVRALPTAPFARRVPG
ncbi:endonuclease domain-containing protein [Leifsonia sp. NPDC102414]|uniref:endonuclease domain-containing protein n=1 Tax=Leifsonia sp. NPDC102414 TaxID=3364124 RepID=UPI00382D6280